MTETASAPKSMMQRFLDTVEQVGNRVPHPVIIFLILIGFVIALSAILEATGASVTYQVINPETHAIETVTTHARSLASASGIRDMYVRLVPNFMGFAAIGLLVVAMVGVGVAEEAGLIKALIRMIVAVAPAWSITYLLAFVGVLSSIAADAGYVVLIPLAGAAFLSIGRHPLAGIALGFAAVAGAFNLNMLIKPLDAVLTELTNDAIRMVDPSRTIDLTAGLWFSIVSVPLLRDRDRADHRSRHLAAAGQVRSGSGRGHRARRAGLRPGARRVARSRPWPRSRWFWSWESSRS